MGEIFKILTLNMKDLNKRNWKVKDYVSMKLIESFLDTKKESKSSRLRKQISD